MEENRIGISVKYRMTESRLCQATMQVIEADDVVGKDVLPSSNGQRMTAVRWKSTERFTWTEVEKDVVRCLKRVRDEIARRRALTESRPDDYYVVI